MSSVVAWFEPPLPPTPQISSIPRQRDPGRSAMTKLYATSAPSRRHIIKGLLTAGLATPAILRTGAAFAAYPERPVRIIVANTPGGPSDIIARIVAAALQETIGGAMFVENRGGAGGNIGMGLAA